MCERCWREHGSPKIWHQKIQEAVDTIREVYEYSSSGGNLHIVIDDFNIEDGNLTFCHDRSHMDLHASPHQLMAEERCYNALIQLTEDERASALALHDGYWVAS